MMLLRLSSLALAGLVAAAAAAEAATLAPHRAVYDLTLKSSTERSTVRGASGRMVLEVAGGACEGWSISFRMVNEFILDGGAARVMDSRSSMWEAGSADTMRYVHRQYVDSALQEEKEIRASRGSDGNEGSGVVTKPAPESFTLPADTIFPVAHQLKLVETAVAGHSRDESIVYDGSTLTQPALAISFIGDRRDAELAPEEGVTATRGLLSWPVSISYFKLQPGDTEMPDYQVDMRLYENGVSGDMILDYGDFVLGAELKTLEMLDRPTCD